MKTKLKIIIPAAVAVIAVIIAIIFIKLPEAGTVDTDSLMSTAQKYLVELDYEQAIAEFEKIIELEPNNVDAYLGLAQAYRDSGNIDKAIEILEKGYELTGDERLRDMLEELTGATVVEETETETTIAEAVTTSVPQTTTTPVTTTTAPVATTAAPVTTEKKAEYITIKGEKYSTDLTTLDLSYKDLSNDDIKDLDKMINLTSLNLQLNQISDISVLKGLTNLEYLELENNQISDISALKGLTNLESLSLSGNSISDISALKGLTNLEGLLLDYNQISDISALKGLTNLETLWLNYNQISDISALKGLTNLKSLDLPGNQINESDIEELKKALPNCNIYY